MSLIVDGTSGSGVSPPVNVGDNFLSMNAQNVWNAMLIKKFGNEIFFGGEEIFFMQTLVAWELRAVAGP